MKKRIIILIISTVLLIALITGITYLYVNSIKTNSFDDGKLEIYEKLVFFAQDTPLEETNDSIIEEYNNFLKNMLVIDNIDFDTFKENITFDSISNDIANTKEMVDNELNYIEPLFSVYDNNIYSLVKDDNYKEIYLKIYENSKYVQDKDIYLEKLDNYQNKLKKLENYIAYLENNTDKYYFLNGKIVYKDDQFKNGYDEFLDLNLNISIEKEIIRGKKIPILMYHGVLDNPWGIANLFVRVNEFDNQMNYLKEQGYTPLYMSEINQAVNYEKPIIITFDDGYVDVYTNAYPILKKYGFKANAYIISDWIGGDVMMNRDMVIELSNNNFEIGSHTLTHAVLGSSTEAEIERQLSESKTNLEALISKPVTSLAYPTGSYDGRVIRIASKYYNYALTTVEGNEYEKTMSRYVLRRVRVNRGMSVSSFANALNGQ